MNKIILILISALGLIGTAFASSGTICSQGICYTNYTTVVNGFNLVPSPNSSSNNVLPSVLAVITATPTSGNNSNLASNSGVNTINLCTNYIIYINGLTTCTTDSAGTPEYGIQSSCQAASIYAGSLVIYLNPQGYFEYVLSTSGGSNNPSCTPVPQALPTNTYQDVAPDTSTLTSSNNFINTALICATTPANASQCPQYNVDVTDYTYAGVIFYSNLIDISPLEVSNLSVYDFFNFVQGNINQFYNSTLLLDSSQTILNPTSIGQSALSFVSLLVATTVQIETFGLYDPQTNITSTIYQINANLHDIAYINTTQNILPIVTQETTYSGCTSVSSSQPTYYNSQQGYSCLLYVTYNYEDTYLETDVNTFNMEFDNEYLPILEINEFLGATYPAMLILLVIFFVMDVMDGEQ